MHKHDQESLLIKTLSEGYTITAACKRAGVSRMFYNRHYKDDRKFRKEVDKALTLGKQTTDDRVASMFTKKMSDGNWQAIKYYMEHNMAPYMKKSAAPQHGTGIPRGELVPSPKKDTYAQFVLWSAMTPEERAWHGIETREQFCRVHEVPNVGLLEIWTKRRDFKSRVTIFREDWAFSKTSEVLGSVYAAACNGDHRSQRLWLEHVHHMTEKYDPDKPKRIEVTPDDIRYMIDGLPEPMKTRNYERLREIIDEMADAARAGAFDEYEKAGVLDGNGKIVPDTKDDGINV